MKHDQAGLKQKVKNLYIMGLPNTGKTTIFNDLSGEYGLVANYPLTTVQIQEKTVSLRKQPYRIMDTPGLHGLYIYSEEELVIRESVFQDPPDLIIQCVDADRLKQSLFLTSDLAELGIPMVLALTSIDETGSEGSRIDSQHLEESLGLPVVEYITKEGRGVRALKRALEHAAVPAIGLQYSTPLEEAVQRIAETLPPSVPFKRKTSLLLLQGDSRLLADDAAATVEAERRAFHEDITTLLHKRRNLWVDATVAEVIRSDHSGTVRGNFLGRLSHLSRHPIFGLPLLLGFLLLCYFSVVHIANLLSDFLTFLLVEPVLSILSRSVPAGFLQDFLIGDYGVLTLGVFNAVITVLPVLTVFFLIFGFMEDIGYLPNVTVLMKRLLGRIGLTGKSIMPLILGFGCKTMATLTTKSIPSRKEKLIAIFMIAFAIPCAAQLALNMAILGKSGILSFLIAFGFLGLVEVAAGAVLNKLLKEDKRTAFIQELSPFRAPKVGALLKKTGYRVYWFLKESMFVFIIAAAALFFLDYFRILTYLKTFLEPIIVQWLGLPLDMVDALILTMARHEAGAGLILRMSEAGRLNVVQSIVAVVITTMFVPCFANIVAIFKEVGIRTGLAITLSINISSFTLAGMLHWFLILLFRGLAT